ncbi:beta-galactosidase [Cerasicoccus fimbriatus]|uniref:beta-galactosidase n=1 Tax=Cerasicoccus fimbriatus TaxID=3014554 RepID=UPI0022B337BA|nr:beta-galactosidase [Cerasicoccus sp. TK19100]
MDSNKLYLGAAWYPEQYPRNTWEEDLHAMRRLGLNTVRIAEFGWACFEPEEGRYETDWLLDAMDLAHANDIECVVCTPTATPPVWLLEKHPEVGYVEPDGYQHKHGARQHASYNSTVFREYARKITQAIVPAIAGHPALLAWQTDNELGSHQQRCLGQDSVRAWHRWLENRYGDIETLNREWCTVVWSQRYASFDQVPPPYRLCYYTQNFALTLNYRRFMADAIASFQREQAEIIRQHSDAPVTHNSTALTDDWRLSRVLDFASSDLYTHNQSTTAIQFRFDSLRNILKGKPFWTLETASEDFMRGELYAEGWMGCYSFINYMMGGTGFFYWPWKQQPGGAEIINNSIVYANGQPATGWMNAAESSETRTKLEPIRKAYRPAKAEVVFVRSEVNGCYFFADWAGGLEQNYNYNKRVREHYQTLLNLGIWRDVVFDEAELPDCRVIVSPYLPYASDEFIERALTLVEEGAVWIAGPYTGFRTQDHGAQQEHLLGQLEKRIGFRTRYILQAGELDVEIGGRPGRTNQFAIMFEPSEADEVLGVYTSKRFAGIAWGLRRTHGKGIIYIPGSELDEQSRCSFLDGIFERENVKRYPAAPDFSCIPLVGNDGDEAWGLCNYGTESRQVSIGDKTIFAASDGVQQTADSVSLSSFSWAVAR